MLTQQVDFALTEAAYTTVRLLQEFPDIAKPESEPFPKLGQEAQSTTVTLTPAKGCKVEINSYH